MNSILCISQLGLDLLKERAAQILGVTKENIVVEYREKQLYEDFEKDFKPFKKVCYLLSYEIYIDEGLTIDYSQLVLDSVPLTYFNLSDNSAIYLNHFSKDFNFFFDFYNFPYIAMCGFLSYLEFRTL